MKNETIDGTQEIGPTYPSVKALAKDLEAGYQTVYDGLRNGTIPSIRLGRRYIIPRTAIAEWLRTAGGKLS